MRAAALFHLIPHPFSFAFSASLRSLRYIFFEAITLPNVGLLLDNMPGVWFN
jgi:hypothetical protein